MALLPKRIAEWVVIVGRSFQTREILSSDSSKTLLNLLIISRLHQWLVLEAVPHGQLVRHTTLHTLADMIHVQTHPASAAA